MIYYLIIHLVCMFIGSVLMARSGRKIDAEAIMFLILTGPLLFIIIGFASLVVKGLEGKDNNPRNDGE